MVRFSCFNARKLYQIGVNNGGVFNAQIWVLSRGLFAGLCFKPAGFGYNLAVLAGEPPFLQPTNFWSRVHERHY